VSGERSHDGVTSSILRFASILAVLLVVAGLFAVAPSASADKILFERRDGWSVMRSDGSGLRRLTDYGSGQMPDLTRDGRRLVWAGGFFSTAALITGPFARPPGRVVWRGPGGGGAPLSPRWSPSGKRIAAMAIVEPLRDRFFQLFVIRPGGGPARRLRTAVSMGLPSWSPDGRRIVAHGTREQTICSPSPGSPFPVCESAVSGGLWVINVATGAEREILDLGAQRIGAPAWSPNGRRIAFTWTEPGNTEAFQIWTVRPDGTGLSQLTRLPNGADGWAPSWSPDGRRIALATRRGDGGSDIATIRADGSGLRVLTRRGENFRPAWSR
jgi:dipeptidyl aminopeptidase/acylaminoacyl peptidase